MHTFNISKCLFLLVLPLYLSAMDDANHLLRSAAKKILVPGFATLTAQAEAALAGGADVNFVLPGEFNVTPLLYAANSDNLVIAQWLIDHKAAIDSVSEDGLVPLSAAIYRKNPKMVLLLLNKGANPIFKIDNECHSSHLYLAVAGGFKKIVKLLLRYGADMHVHLTCQNEFGAKLAISPFELAHEPAYMYPEITQILDRANTADRAVNH